MTEQQFLHALLEDSIDYAAERRCDPYEVADFVGETLVDDVLPGVTQDSYTLRLARLFVDNALSLAVA
jgi:hypothetical protein